MSERELADLYVLLTANTRGFVAGMGEATGASEAFEHHAGNVGKAALGIAAGAVTAGVATATALVKMAGDFESLTTTIVTGAGEDVHNLGMIRDGVLAMAGEVGQTPDNLAKGLYMIESAGYHGAAGLEVLRVAAQGAAVGEADMATVSNALTSILNAYHLSAGNAVMVTDELVATVAQGKMHMEDLAGALGKVVPAAAVLHIPFAEIGGALATMTMQGDDAATASTHLRQILLALAHPTSKARDELASLGLSAHEVGAMLTSGRPDALESALTAINVALDKKFPASAKIAQQEFANVRSGLETTDEAMARLSEQTTPEYMSALATISGGNRQLAGLLELTGANQAVFHANTLKIATAARQAGKDVDGWSLVQGDFNHKLDDFKGAAASAAISLGTELLPAVGWIVDGMSKAAAAVDHNLVPAMRTALPSIESFGSTIINQVGHPLVEIAETVMPPVIDALKFLGDHTWIVEGALGAMAARWVLIKSLGMASAVLEMATAFTVFAGAEGGGGVLGALRALVGLNSNQGLMGSITQFRVMRNELAATTAELAVTKGETIALAEQELVLAAQAEMGGAAMVTAGEEAAVSWTAMLGPIGLAIAAIAGVAYAIHELTQSPDWDEMERKMRDNIQGSSQEFFDSFTQGTAKAEQQLADFRQSMDGMAATLTRLGRDSAFQDSLGISIDQFDQLDSAAQAVVMHITGDKPLVEEFFRVYTTDGGDATQAVRDLAAAHPALRAMLDSITDGYNKQKQAAKEALDQENRQVDTAYDKAVRQRKAIESVYMGHGLTKKAADDLFASANPQGAQLIANAESWRIKLGLSEAEFNTLRQNDALPFLDAAGQRVLGTIGALLHQQDLHNRTLLDAQGIVHSVSVSLVDATRSAWGFHDAQSHIASMFGAIGDAAQRGMNRVGDAFHNAANHVRDYNDAASRSPSAPPDSYAGHHATGGFMGMGEWSWLGEGGPELGHLTSGGMQIYTHEQSMQMVGGSIGAGGGARAVNHITIAPVITINAGEVRDPERLALMLRDRLIDLGRSSGLDSLFGRYA